MHALGGKDMGLDQPKDGHQGEGRRTNLIGKRGDAQRHAFASEALRLAVERLVLPILLEQQHGEEAWPCPATRHDMEWRGRLRDLLAVTAGELLAYGLDDLPGTRDYLQRLGYILAQLRQAHASTGRTGTRRRND